MDGSGGNMQSSEERGVEKQMDDYLKSIGLHRKKIAKDGSCLFRAVAEQVLHCQSLHTKVRAKCVEFLKQNRDTYEAFIEGDFEDYLCKLQDPQQWVGEVEINALAAMYKRDFLIFQEPGKPAVNITDNNFKDQVQLCFLNGNHYDSVYPINHIKSTALCQSILYELLYEGVFKVDRACLGPCQWTSRPSDPLSDDGMIVCVSSDESDLDSSEALRVENGTGSTSKKHNNQSYRSRGRGRQLPERVRRSLNPTLLRNVEYDVWLKTKRAQQKMDYCIAAGMHFTVGDRCQVRLEGSNRTYNATIREVPSDNQLVTVYIEEVGRKQVPLWSLRPPGDDSGWSTVGNRDKRLSNGHGEWEERGKGRGRGKSIPSSSGSQAAAPGSGGRVLKQHSWPAQTTTEEQGGSKTTRKSVGTPEVAFGLTEEQRLAKEEAQRNVALVEIRLRDEQSFPALGSQPGIQGDGGKKKGGEKKRSQRNKMKSPVEDVRAPSPPARDGPKSSTPPVPVTTTSAPPDKTTPTSPALPAAKSPADSTPARLSSNKTSMANNTASSANVPLTCAAPTTKTNTPSYASAAAAPSSPPPAAAAAPSSKPSLTGGALPPSVPSSAILFSYGAPLLPAASPTSASSSSTSKPSPTSLLPPKTTTSPPPSSSVPPPTFITPIAAPPVATHGLPARSSPPVSSLSRSPTPPSFPSLNHPSGQVQEAPPAPAPAPPPTTNSLPKTGHTLMSSQAFKSQPPLPEVHSQVSLPQNQNQISVFSTVQQAEPSLPQIQTQSQTSQPLPVMMPQMLNDHQNQPQSEAAPLPQTDLHPHIQSPHPPPAASYPFTSQASLTHPLIQPPHPSQVPHPSLSLSASPGVPQTQMEAPPPPPQQSQPLPESPAPPPPEKPPPPHASLPGPPHPQPIPGAVPLQQQLSQLYLDPLYPGFPQGEKGEPAPTPHFSTNKSGEDLPQDINILRFFFNLGVKAYSNSMFPPYMYLIPLHHAHAYTVQPKPSSRSPSPAQPPPNPPTKQQEACPPPQYVPCPAPVPPQYDHQVPLDEAPRPTEPSFSQPGYTFTQTPPHRMPFQQIPASRNPSYSVGYPSPPPPYPGPPPSSQSYHPSQGMGHPIYSPHAPPYPPSSLAYQAVSTPQELQGVSQGVMQQLQPTNGDMMPGHGNIRVPCPLDNPAAANVANTNNNQPVVIPSVYGFKKEVGETSTRAVLLVDPPLNDRPIVALVTDSPMKDSSSSSLSPFRNQKPVHSAGIHSHRGSYLKPITMVENQSVGCSTEDDWDDVEAFKSTSHRGQRKIYRSRGGRGRGSYDPARSSYRNRHEREMPIIPNYVQSNPHNIGWSRERRY